MMIWDSMDIKAGQTELRLAQTMAFGGWNWVKFDASKVGLALETEEEIDLKQFPSTKFLVLEKRYIEDIGWMTYFTVLDKSLQSPFESLCKDLIAVTRDMETLEQCVEVMVKQLNLWIKLFKGLKRLTLKDIIGLYGELLFLKTWLAKGYSLEEWVGPSGAAQDFQTKDQKLAVEVKTVLRNAEVCNISSVEQLDFHAKLYLCVYQISPSDNAGMTLNQLVEEIRQTLSEVQQRTLMVLLLEAGYQDQEEMSNIALEVKTMEIFMVTSDFPRIKKSDMSEAIVDCRYNINLDKCRSFAVETIENSEGN